MKPYAPITAYILVTSGDVFHNLAIQKPKAHPSAIMVTLVLWIAASTFLWSQQTHGTAAVMVWNPERVVLATDSKILSYDGQAPATATACKIRASGKFFFAASGLYGGSDFDSFKAIADAIRQARTVPEAAEVSEKVFLPVLKEAIEKLKAEDPVAFSRFTKGADTPMFSVFFIGIDSGKTWAAGWQYRNGGQVSRSEIPGAGRVVPTSRAYMSFGEHDEIAAALSPQDIAKLLTDPIATARTMIQIEIDQKPSNVGPPLAILEVTPSGHRWVEKGLCGDDDKKQ